MSQDITTCGACGVVRIAGVAGVKCAAGIVLHLVQILFEKKHVSVYSRLF